MKWRARAVSSRAKERANISFFIFIMFFAVFGVIVLTELLLLERPNVPGSARSRYSENLQGWEGRTETGGGENGEPPPPAHSPLDGVWQPVAGTRFRFYVYSAYVERRTVAAVRIIAATKTRGADHVICRLWLPDNRTLTLKARVKAIRENWNLKYSATYVLCLLRESGVKPQETVGASISVLSSNLLNRPPTNLLTVLDTEPKRGIEHELHICVKPFHYSYARNEWLVEWFELNRLLGASHFYMYNESLSAPVTCLLDHYRKQGLVTLLPWKLPIVSKVEIRTEGQFAAFNDCLYRSMSNAGWLLVIDVDEIVLPRRERTLPALLTALRAMYDPPSKAPGAFLFRNAFFYLRWDDDPEGDPSLVTSRKTRRWATPLALKNRSKYALRPRDAVELGNHFVWELAPGASSAGVPTDRALLHHYRMACEYGGLNCLTVPSTIDRTAHRWADELKQRIDAEKKRLSTTCIAFKFYVYSAYVERRTVAAVRIIAATKTRGADHVICRLWLPDNRTLTLKAKVKAIRENWNLKYSATYVLCLLCESGVKPQETVGASISVLSSNLPYRPPTNRLTVLDTEPKSGVEQQLHICVKPFHYSYTKHEWLMEWFELNRLLGASHFYMYNESLSAPVTCLLDHYRKQGLVTLLPWKLPIVSKVEIRTEGQFAAFNDCLYRSMSNAGWLLIIDVDEIVLPRRERTLPALLTALRAMYDPPPPGAFLFRNAFFYLQWEDDTEGEPSLVTSRKTRRLVTPHAFKNRSKYALRPREVVELGNHFVWELSPGASSAGVPSDRALLHHYRITCEYGDFNCLKVPSTIDRIAHRWTDELKQLINAEKKRLSTTCLA